MTSSATVDKMSNSMTVDNKVEKDVNKVNVTDGSVDGKQLWAEVLPKANKMFCFKAEDFADESFSIDSFLKTHRSKVTLEQLKDDLNSYLKVLKTSMIELINEDYNDFINLTTNLMGFDKSINNLSEPLIQLRNSSLKIERQFDEIIRQLDYQMKRQESIRDSKSQLSQVIAVMDFLEKAENWFNDYKNSDNSSDDDNNGLSSLEKIALIAIKIETHLKSIEFDIPLLSDQIIPRFEALDQSLRQTLESEFFSAITDNNSEQLMTTLRICSLNCRQSELENIFRLKVVKPYMNDVICETFLEKSGIDLSFKTIIEFIDLKCRLIIGVNDSDYSFMINSVWNEISNCLMVRTTSLFSVGNPDHFHSQYLSTVSFIDSFITKSQIKRSDLESDPNYKEFINKFNVEVYFHIRYQQMATKCESTLEEHTFNFDSNQHMFKFLVTTTFYECLTTSWCPQTVYISVLFPSFWRITVQLFSRYNFWLKSLKETDFNEVPNQMTQQSNRLSNKLILMGLLINDCEKLIIESKKFFDSNIIALKPSAVDSQELRDAFNESIVLLEKNGLQNMVSLMKTSLVKQCDLFLGQINDLPLLYRRTNKVPTKASNYINNCFDLIASVVLNSTKVWRTEWTPLMVNQITSHFKEYTSEILTSVQNTEQSLKRLNEVRGGDTLNNQIKNSNTMSDDDKIRLQIYYDVQQYAQQVRITSLFSNSMFRLDSYLLIYLSLDRRQVESRKEFSPTFGSIVRNDGIHQKSHYLKRFVFNLFLKF